MTESDRVKKELETQLRLYGNEVVFYTSDGRTLNNEEMLLELENNSEIGNAFLESIYGAAFQVLGIRQRQGKCGCCGRS